MKKICLIVLVQILFLLPSHANSQVDSLLKQLENVLQQKDVFLQQKRDRITALESIINTQIQDEDLYYRYSIFSKLFAEYKSFNYDSSFMYVNKMVKIAFAIKNPELIADAKIDMSFVLLSSGLFREALDTLLSINPVNLATSIQIKYFQTLNRAWIDLSDYSQDNFYSDVYNEKGNVALNNAIALTDSSSKAYYFLNGLYNLRNGNMQKSEYYYSKLLKISDLPLQEQAVVTSSLGHVYRVMGDIEKSIALLVRAAEIDIQTATKETVALTKLAEVLYQQGYSDFSLRCVNQALEDANFYGARHRKVQISDVLPIIESSLLRTKEKQSRIFMVYSIVLTFLVILLVVLAVIVGKQNSNLKRTKKILDQTISNLKETNRKLSEVNRIKEEYIGHFFDVISNYIEKIEKLKKSISRKIMMKQVSEIETTINSIDLIKEREELFASFDSIFIKLFPTFIEKFNSFVSPEDQFQMQEGIAFSPELRIYALKRLGIQDNEKIARFLGYSVTTIYTYKTKLKKRSPNHDINLEESLMNIQME